MTYRDGHIYTGQFKDWRMFGSGKMTFRNGDVVEGVWDGETGKGTITYTDGSMYEVCNVATYLDYSLPLSLSRENSKRIRRTEREPTLTLMATNTQECTR